MFAWGDLAPPKFPPLVKFWPCPWGCGSLLGKEFWPKAYKHFQIVHMITKIQEASNNQDLREEFRENLACLSQVMWRQSRPPKASQPCAKVVRPWANGAAATRPVPIHTLYGGLHRLPHHAIGTKGLSRVSHAYMLLEQKILPLDHPLFWP